MEQVKDRDSFGSSSFLNLLPSITVEREELARHHFARTNFGVPPDRRQYFVFGKVR